VTWEPFEVEKIRPSSVERSRHRFRAHLPELIWNTAALEGNNFTLPEVRTLLEGVTVGGKKLEDEKQIIALSEAYNHLDDMVGAGQFELSKEVSDELHRLVPGTEHGEGGALLREHFTVLVDYLKTVSDPRHRALIYFASATRRQFYFDGNKRTARLMMTGELMSDGYDIVSVPFSRKLEFNSALDVLFDRDDATELLRFLSTCNLAD
jgi:Fic family protein